MEETKHSNKNQAKLFWEEVNVINQNHLRKIMESFISDAIRMRLKLKGHSL